MLYYKSVRVYQKFQNSKYFPFLPWISCLVILVIFTKFFYSKLMMSGNWESLLGIFIFAFLLSFPPSIFFKDFLKKFKISRQKLIISLVLLTFLFIFLYGALCINKHNNFLTGYDLAIFDQAIWRLSIFEIPESSIRNVPVIFADHFDPIISFLTPLYWIWSNVKILLLAQIIILISGILPLYLICQHFKFNSIFTFLICLVYLIAPGLQSAIIYDFHEIAFAPVLFLSSFYFFLRRRWPYFFLFLLLLIFTKENLALFLIGFGLFLLFLEKSKKIGLTVLAIGITSLFLITGFILPGLNLNQSNYTYFEMFPGFEGGLIQGIMNALKDPLPLLSFLVHPLEKWWVSTLFLSFFIFAIFIFPLSLFLFLPLVIEKLISSYPLLWTMRGYYNLLFVPAGIIAIFMAFKKIEEWEIKKRFPVKFSALLKNLIVIFPLIAILIWTFHFSYLFHYYSGFEEISNEPIIVEELNEIINLIPKDASVSASQIFLPHLSHRRNIYLLPRISDAKFIVLQKFSTNVWPLKSWQQEQFYLYLKDHSGFEIISENSSAALFERTVSSNQKLKKEFSEICLYFIKNSKLEPIHEEYLLENCLH